MVVLVIKLLLLLISVLEVPEEEQAVDLLGRWLDQILANISIRIENLTVKYQSGDVIVSVSSKLLEIASSSSHPLWMKQFVVLYHPPSSHADSYLLLICIQ
jgi:hypothetical protein